MDLLYLGICPWRVIILFDLVVYVFLSEDRKLHSVASTFSWFFVRSWSYALFVMQKVALQNATLAILDVLTSPVACWYFVRPPWHCVEHDHDLATLSLPHFRCTTCFLECCKLATYDNIKGVQLLYAGHNANFWLVLSFWWGHSHLSSWLQQPQSLICHHAMIKASNSHWFWLVNYWLRWNVLQLKSSWHHMMTNN